MRWSSQSMFYMGVQWFATFVLLLLSRDRLISRVDTQRCAGVLTCLEDCQFIPGDFVAPAEKVTSLKRRKQMQSLHIRPLSHGLCWRVFQPPVKTWQWPPNSPVHTDVAARLCVAAKKLRCVTFSIRYHLPMHPFEVNRECAATVSDGHGFCNM